MDTSLIFIVILGVANVGALVFMSLREGKPRCANTHHVDSRTL